MSMIIPNYEVHRITAHVSQGSCGCVQVCVRVCACERETVSMSLDQDLGILNPNPKFVRHHHAVSESNDL